MSFIDVAIAIGLEGTAATVGAGAMMGGAMTVGGNVIQGRNPFDNIGQGMLMGGFTAGITPFVSEGLANAGYTASKAAAAGITAGALGYATTGDIGKGLTAGLSAYGLSNLGGNLETAGGEALANEATFTNANNAGSVGGATAVDSGMPEMALNDIDVASSQVPKTTVDEYTRSLRNQGMSEQQIQAKLSAAGKSAVGSNPMSFLKRNATNLMQASAPMFADQAVQSNMPQTLSRAGMIRPYSYDPYGGTYTAYDPYQYTAPTRAADGGLMGFDESSNAPITRRNIDAMQNTDGMFNFAQDGGPALRMARGGLAAFADGGINMTSPYLNAINNPETIALMSGETQAQGLARIQAQQQEFDERNKRRIEAAGQQAPATIDYTQSPAGLNPSSPAVQTQADVDYWTKRVADSQGSNFTTGGGGGGGGGQDQVAYIKSLMANNPAPVGRTNAQMMYDQQTEQARTKANREAVGMYQTGDGFQIAGGYIGRPPTANETDTVVTGADGKPRYLTKDEEAKQKAYADSLYDKYKPIAPTTGFAGIQNTPAPSGTLNVPAAVNGPPISRADTNAPNVPNAPNTPSAAQQYKDQHLVDPTTGHLVNPTLSAQQQQQMRDGINTNAEMRAAYDSYWNTVKPGDVLDFAGGTLTMNPDGTATHTYTDGNGKQQSYTFSRGTDFATVAKSDPNIAKEWKDMFNYSPYGTSTGGGGTTVTTAPNIPGRPTGGFTGMTDVRNAYTAGGGNLGYTPYVPTSIQDFEDKYNKQTGGSAQAYNYLRGKADYSPVPYTKDGQVQKSYAESVLGVPQDISTKKYLFQDGKYVKNPAFRPPKPVGTPAEGKEWTWDDTGKKWAQTDKKPEQSPINTAVNNDISNKNGGLMALAGGGMAERYNLGGYSDGGRLLRGPGDGVSDSIPATIGHKQPARLADGEFVVPARIVSELGNGSTEAGARKLYAMMDRVQSARRSSIGKGNVAKNSRADKHLPA